MSSVFLRNGIEYDRARILQIRLDEMHDLEILFLVDTVATHNATAVEQRNGCCTPACTTGWFYHRPPALSTIGDLCGSGWLSQDGFSGRGLFARMRLLSRLRR
ncbi:hypothetical protein, partial [Cryobacterium aureum]|uniref:hypothetical protein n=1 Tax=Cryobacterium aureum TaxID=995037 RepID=UPI00196A84C2